MTRNMRIACVTSAKQGTVQPTWRWAFSMTPSSTGTLITLESFFEVICCKKGKLVVGLQSVLLLANQHRRAHIHRYRTKILLTLKYMTATDRITSPCTTPNAHRMLKSVVGSLERARGMNGALQEKPRPPRHTHTQTHETNLIVQTKLGDGHQHQGRHKHLGVHGDVCCRGPRRSCGTRQLGRKTRICKAGSQTITSIA